MWTIRKATLQDALSIQKQLHQAYRPIKKQGYNMEATDVSLETVEENVRQHEVFVLVNHERCIKGTVRLKNHSDDMDHLGWFSISPDLKGFGLGKKVIDYAEERSRKRGRHGIYLDTAKDHPWLPSLYEKLGYQKVGVIRWPDQNFDAVQFEKQL
ncbi:N-acetylglutamate synthase, GNAT family [Marininema mesophilum]|uniref:N-acetylglutamate synthase, GNAT family n=1 Tax=Marininema mesophilum TaxID=1048340 RepID=A0A1H2SHC8_9BACL|nr:GNAT family N-acetyltransferase [Marininema mesophilum]SDW30942.1 N-acetylglutamate synthase, GNAT family [Marininema mesophilum]